MQLLTDIEVQINKLIDEERMPNFEAYAPRVKVEEAPKPPAKPVFGRRAAQALQQPAVVRVRI